MNDTDVFQERSADGASRGAWASRRILKTGAGRLRSLGFLCLMSITGWAQVPAEVLDDDAIVARIESETSALAKAGKLEKSKGLRAALARAKTCALALPAPEAAVLSPEELHARRVGGVVIVGVMSRGRKKGKYELAGCTGFAVAAGGVIVTNYHVIDSTDAETLVAMTHDYAIAPITEILAADKLADVAIVRAPGLSPAPIPLARQRPAPGAPLWAISHPDHNFFCLTSGLVSRHFMATTEFGKTPQMAVTADFGAGSSGGPLLDRQGSVTGMVCSTTSLYYEDTKGKVKDLQMVFKHCVPAESILRLVTAPVP